MVTEEKKQILKGVAAKFGLPFDWVHKVTLLESGYNAAAKNKYSTATGIWQWIARTANSLGYTTQSIAVMDFQKQANTILPAYIKANLKAFKNARTFIDFYLVVFYPVASNKPDYYKFPSSVVRSNPYIDINKDGTITKAEFAKNVYGRLAKLGERLPSDAMPITMEQQTNGTTITQQAMQVERKTAFFFIAAAASIIIFVRWLFK